MRWFNFVVLFSRFEVILRITSSESFDAKNLRIQYSFHVKTSTLKSLNFLEMATGCVLKVSFVMLRALFQRHHRCFHLIVEAWKSHKNGSDHQDKEQ
ncbi:uncharacterized protein L203_106446 [Cryptococcus depauperatus CBS 7841]|uniref:Uncharacterized protein n=1 Tax=Cryptococcus depauperatus CBS 7841 TaxID=1295531 RepID=A0AAJ8JZI8_9TREE